MRTDPGLSFSKDFKPQGINLPGRHFQDGVSQSGHERNHLFLAEAGAYVDVSGVSGTASIADGRAVALLDFDSDGRTDIALANANAPMFELYQNQISGGGFVAVRFVGGNRDRAVSSLSNRDGFGAVIEARIGDKVLVREHRAGEGMAAQSSATLLIGTGQAKIIDEVTIRWPSGLKTQTSKIPIGTLLTAYEESTAGKHFERRAYGVPEAGAVDLKEAVTRAIEFVGRSVGSPDPSWAGLVNYMHRRFRIPLEVRSPSGAGQDSSPMARIFARIDDPAATIPKQEIADLEHVVDRITASALHCDRITLPPNWVEILGKASRAGGYALTHAALASRWTVENGCLDEAAVAGLQSEQIGLLVDFVDKRRQWSARYEAATDMWFEAVVMLYYLDAGSQVRREWIREILKLQRSDGGWARTPREDRSDTHASVLALWALLENREVVDKVPWLGRQSIK